MHLSKSRIKQGIQCKKGLYLQIYQPKLARPITENEKKLFDQGHSVQKEAEKIFKNGYRTQAPYWDFNLALMQTNTAIEKNYPYIYEAFFAFNQLLARVDILELKEDHWNLIEVKSSLSIKEDHVHDLAIQKYILDSLGHKVRHCYIMHINKACVYPDLEDLFVKKDITDRVNACLPKIDTYIRDFQTLLRDKKGVPDIAIGPHCNKPYPCRFIPHCWKSIPKPSVFNIPRMGEEAWEYYNEGKIDLKDIPNKRLEKRQQIYKKVQMTGEPYIQKDEIKKEMSTWKWPLYFLDFETISGAIPKFEKSQPFQHVPFQFSCLKQNSIDINLTEHLNLNNEKDPVLAHSTDGEVTESHYLHMDATDPRKNLAEGLVNFIKGTGSIAAYYKQFEAQRLRELASVFPEYAEQLLDIESRLVDPLPLLRESVFFKDFGSSWSIKSIAPVLLGEDWSYSKLDVQHGLMAQSQFYSMIQLKDEQEKLKMRNQLITYCRQDTLTLALISKWLFEQI